MHFSISLSSTDPRLDFSSPIHTSPEEQCLSMTHFFCNTSHIQRRLDLSRGSRPTYSRLDPLRERRPYPLLPVSRPLTGETSPYIVLFLLSICKSYSFPLSPLTHFNMRHYLGGAVHIRMRLPRHAIINSLFSRKKE